MLTILQKGTCEAIWRAHEERGVDLTATVMPEDPTSRRRYIEDFVSMCRTKDLARIALPEVENFGRLKGGYGERWGGPSKWPAPPPSGLDLLNTDMQAPD